MIFFSLFQRKLLAVYFHHDSSVLTNVFCTQALCAESVCGFLNENFVSFGWDLTFSSNKTRAVDMITKHFGSVAASTLKNMDIERLPMLVIIQKLRGSIEIHQVCVKKKPSKIQAMTVPQQFCFVEFLILVFLLTNRRLKRSLNAFTRENAYLISTARFCSFPHFSSLQIIHGNMTLDELMSRLLQTHEQYTAQLAVEIREEDERAERDAVKREQDLAFQESLKVRSKSSS